MTSAALDRADTSYWLSHRPGDLEAAADPDSSTAFAYDIVNGNWPSDILENPDWYLPYRGDRAAQESVAVMRRIQGDPDAWVTVYRGAPSDDLNTGDWVTFSKTYAEDYAGDAFYSDNPDSRVNAYRVQAKYLTWDGDSFNEIGYWGERKRAK